LALGAGAGGVAEDVAGHRRRLAPGLDGVGEAVDGQPELADVVAVFHPAVRR